MLPMCITTAGAAPSGVEIETKMVSGKNKHTGDKELLHTKASYAQLLKSIFSKEDWKTYCEFFPLLREYWED